MISAKVLKSSSEAGKYYSQADYYSKDSPEGDLNSQWQGKGAEKLGLSGAVDAGVFKQLLEGKLPDGTALGRAGKDGEKIHKPGWDFTFSAPKSVSLLALVGGDERLTKAHKEAVAEALSYMEKQTMNRVTVNGKTVLRPTGNAIIASFTHTTSRALDPQLHTHNVFINATERVPGEWRSVESKAFYDHALVAGQVYRSALMGRVKSLGYTIDPLRHGLFELKEVPEHVREVFSQRRKEIVQAAKERGLKTAKQMDKAAIMTRASKQTVDQQSVVSQWEERMQATDIDIENTVREAVDKGHQRSVKKDFSKGQSTARESVLFAMKKLSEREAVVGRNQLLQEALIRSKGRAGVEDVERAVTHYVRQGTFEDALHFHEGDTGPGYTTPDAVSHEKTLLGIVSAGRDKITPIAPEKMVRNYLKKTQVSLDKGQTEAALAILSSRDEVVGVQGYAGTGKTRMLKTVKAVARHRRVEVKGFAPTGTAAEKLMKESGISSRTVASHLWELENRAGKTTPFERIKKALSGQKQLWVVDESSLLSAKSMASLLSFAQQEQAKVALVGDGKQLGSVEWGKLFVLLKDSGMKTASMTDIWRQKGNEPLRQAVYKSIDGDIRSTIGFLHAAGEAVEEIPHREKRVEALVTHYLSLSESERKETQIIIPDHQTRQEIHVGIRAGLQEQGGLGPDQLSVTALSNAQFYDVEKADSRSYQPGMVVEFGNDNASLGVKKLTGYEVSGADEEHVYLKDKVQNREIVWNPMKVAGNAEYGVSVYHKEDRKVAVGDPLRVKTTRRQEGLKNGQKGKIVDVRDTIVTIEMSDGTKKSLDLKTMPHWDYDYTLTAFAAQGDEYKRAVVMAESYRRNLVNQRSFYVALSRASSRVKLFTDDAAKLIEKVSVRLGDKTSALQGKLIDPKALFTDQGLVEETRREKQKQDYEKTMEGKLVKGATKIRNALEKVREDRGIDL